MALQHKPRDEYFVYTRTDRNRLAYWKCKQEECVDKEEIAVGNLSKHLFYYHPTIFQQLAADKLIDPVKHKEPKSKEEPTKIEKEIFECEFCGKKYRNVDLGRHRQRPSYIGGEFGCPCRDQFYGNDGKSAELRDVEKKRTKVTEEEIQAASAKATKKTIEQETARILNKLKKKKKDGEITEEERAEVQKKAEEIDGQKGALYVRMSKGWWSTEDQKDPLEHWVYTGSAKNMANRQVKYKAILTTAKQHFFTAASGELDLVMDFDPDAEQPIVLIENIPLILAQALENATILLRADMGKNMRVPFRRNVGMSHSELRSIAAKLLFAAFERRQRIDMSQDESGPIGATPKAPKRKRPPTELDLSGAGTSTASSTSLHSTPLATPTTPMDRMTFKYEEDKKNCKMIAESMTPPKQKQFAHQNKGFFSPVFEPTHWANAISSNSRRNKSTAPPNEFDE